MEWYWWVLIAIAVVVIGYLKLKVWGRIQASRAERKKAEIEVFDD